MQPDTTSRVPNCFQKNPYSDWKRREKLGKQEVNLASLQFQSLLKAAHVHLSHVDGKRFRPAVEQLEEEQALAGRDLVRVVNDKDVIRLCTHHPGQSVLSQERAQVVVGDPAVLPSTFWEVVEEDVQDLVSYVVIGTVEEELQKAVEDTQKWVLSHRERLNRAETEQLSCLK